MPQNSWGRIVGRWVLFIWYHGSLVKGRITTSDRWLNENSFTMEGKIVIFPWNNHDFICQCERVRDNMTIYDTMRSFSTRGMRDTVYLARNNKKTRTDAYIHKCIHTQMHTYTNAYTHWCIRNMIVSHNFLLWYKSFNNDAKVIPKAIEYLGCFLLGLRFVFNCPLRSHAK